MNRKKPIILALAVLPGLCHAELFCPDPERLAEEAEAVVVADRSSDADLFKVSKVWRGTNIWRYLPRELSEQSELKGVTNAVLFIQKVSAASGGGVDHLRIRFAFTILGTDVRYFKASSTPDDVSSERLPVVPKDGGTISLDSLRQIIEKKGRQRGGGG